MLALFAGSELFDLIKSVEDGKRLDYEDGLRLMKSRDILALGYMANIWRERKNGNKTYYTLQETSAFPNPKEATLDYGLLKTPEERVESLLRLRERQDQSGVFLTFLPAVSFQTATGIQDIMGSDISTGLEDLKVLAAARIMLDNIRHVKVLWPLFGLKLTQVAQAFGADTLDGRGLTERVLWQMIRAAGRDVAAEGVG